MLALLKVLCDPSYYCLWMVVCFTYICFIFGDNIFGGWCFFYSFLREGGFVESCLCAPCDRCVGRCKGDWFCLIFALFLYPSSHAWGYDFFTGFVMSVDSLQGSVSFEF